MLRGYESSDSSDTLGVADGQNGPGGAGVVLEGTKASGKSEASGSDAASDDEGPGAAGAVGRLPSAAAAFEAMSEDDLGFKQFAAANERQRRVHVQAMGLERVTAASSATLRGQGWQLPAEVSAPLSSLNEQAPRRSADSGEAAAVGAAQNSASQDGSKGKGKMTVKERTRLKRFKGQSGEDHSGRMWKPEVW
eukprot:CAMPEP_0171098076 /NCGR_PEP_ID=MMETSP0766_2-20121228/47919_1 /TAXON_ID=439317 /ORGANISM="Gambierdiscus australes, Strain CAWD 149" /LENGTH=192 /DNA_ID=CAMNT_0011557375 /DNA_START=128 /DNA_END=703 /DNA_ORIENTATION=+